MTTADPEQYGEHYYANYFGGRPYRADDPAWPAFFGAAADLIVQDIKPKTALDVGCAYGFFVNELRKRGVDAIGFDSSDYAIAQAETVDPDLPESVWVASATEPIDGRYDFVSCIEMIEHLDDSDARVALRNMTSVTDTLFLSSTPGDFAEPTHINVRPVEYWAEILAELDFWRDHDIDTTRIAPWSGLFRRGTPTTRELVRSYERTRFRLQLERSELRAEVVRLNADESAAQLAEAKRVSEANELQLAQEAAEVSGQELMTSRNELTISQDELSAARQHIASLKEELLRARDGYIGMQAEAAEAKSQTHLHATELHHFKTYYEQIEHRIVGMKEEARQTAVHREAIEEMRASTSWRLIWIALSPYRRLKVKLLGHG